MGEASYNLNLKTRNLGERLCDIEKRGIRNKVLNAIFGGKNRVLIIAPESCVESITFTEVGSRGTAGGGEPARKGEGNGHTE